MIASKTVVYNTGLRRKFHETQAQLAQTTAPLRPQISKTNVRMPTSAVRRLVETESPVMSRSTLKLPAKPDLATRTDDPRIISRKPARSGAKQPKQTLAQRETQRAARAAFLAEAERTRGIEPAVRRKPRTDKDRPAPATRASEPVKTASRGERPENPADQSVRPPQEKKVYPKRGIARSTGARAFPPARPARTEGEQRREANRDSATPKQHTNPERLTIKPRETSTQMPRKSSAGIAPEIRAARSSVQEPPRLSKRLCEMTGCSRRAADEWIENGWVKVDGVVVSTLGTRVHPQAKLEISEAAREHKTESVTILLNKPLGDESADPDSDKAALALFRPENRWADDDTPLTFKATHLRGLALAGRLDAQATGMLVFTQEGSVARRITGDETKLEKEYLVTVEGELSEDGLRRLNIGLSLDDIKLKRAQVSWQHEQQLRFVLHENRPRQIQRMCELVGIRAVSIKRLRIGSVALGKLPPGKWRYLRENERF